MKTKLLLLLLFTTISAGVFAHEGVEIGPKGGRILEFSKNETMHGEVTVKDGRFHIAVLDKDMKPVAVDQQTLTAVTGERNDPQKLEVEKTPAGFVLPAVQSGQWLILQFREKPAGKVITARLHYNTETCGECSKPEWLCACTKK